MTEDRTKSQNSSFPEVRSITFRDLREVLSQGLADFRRAPMYGMFFGGMFAVGGWILFSAVLWLGVHWLAYPLVIGFSLIGPFAATGIYEVSRRLETDKPLLWNEILGVVWLQHKRELGWMAFVFLFVFWVWMYQARTLFAVFFGSRGFATMDGFINAVLTTQNGWTFLIVGHFVGAVIAMVLFCLTVVSCPFLLDRDSDFITAMIVSVRSVLASPIVMGSWGLFVITCVVVSAIPAFLGMLVALPVLGHATWHLYRRLVEPAVADAQS